MDEQGELASSPAEVLFQAAFFFCLRGSLREGQGPHLNSGRWQGSLCRCRGWIGRSLRILCTEPRSRAAAAPGRSGRSPEGDFSVTVVS